MHGRGVTTRSEFDELNWGTGHVDVVGGGKIKLVLWWLPISESACLNPSSS